MNTLPESLRVQHGPEIQMLLEDRRHIRVIRRLGTLIVCLSVLLGYLVHWAEEVGL